MAWIECNWLNSRWGAVKAFIPDHIASQYRRFISFRCCLDRMQSCTSSTNLTICPIFGTYCTIGTNVTNQREVCMGVWGVYTVLGETTRNPTNTMVKPLDLQLKSGVSLSPTGSAITLTCRWNTGKKISLRRTKIVHLKISSTHV